MIHECALFHRDAHMPPSGLAQATDEAAGFLRERFNDTGTAVAAIQVGTGFPCEELLEVIEDRAPMGDMPGMPTGDSSAGHELEILLGTCGGNRVLAFSGRRHLYEGHGVIPCVLPSCAASKCGIRNVIQVSAAGAVRDDWKPGTVVAVVDYINGLGTSPLVGHQDLGDVAFPDMTETFSQELISRFVNAADEVGLSPRLGVYLANVGPQFETPSEVAIARRNGADVVGMSLVLETIAAKALGARVMGIAVVANQAASHGGKPISHGTVVDTCRFAGTMIARALRHFFAGDYLPGDEQGSRA